MAPEAKNKASVSASGRQTDLRSSFARQAQSPRKPKVQESSQGSSHHVGIKLELEDAIASSEDEKPALAPLQARGSSHEPQPAPAPARIKRSPEDEGPMPAPARVTGPHYRSLEDWSDATLWLHSHSKQHLIRHFKEQVYRDACVNDRYTNWEAGATRQPPRPAPLRPRAPGPDSSTHSEPLPALKDLALHPKKAQQVRDWLRTAYASRKPNLLILSGPSGAGKSTAVRLLAHEALFQLVEWQNPMSTTDTDSLAGKFDRFLSTADRYPALDTQSVHPRSHLRNLIFVEDLPNIYSYSSGSGSLRETFRQSLLSYLGGTRSASPVVLIITETESRADDDDRDREAVNARALLGNSVVGHPHTTTIPFNKVAFTYLRNALLSALVSEERFATRFVSDAVIRELCQYANGDTRSALNALSLIFPALDPTRPVSRRPKLKRGAVLTLTRVEQDALKLASTRESALDYHHAIGKLLYNKKEVHSNPVEAHRLNGPPVRPENEVSSLLDVAASTPQVFLAGAHRNYLAFTPDVDSAAAFMDHLSVTDVLMERYDKEANVLKRHLATIAVSGMQACLPHTSTSNNPRLFYPSDWQIRRDTNTSRDLADRYIASLPPAMHPRSTAGILEILSCELQIHRTRQASMPSQARLAALLQYRKLARFEQAGVSESLDYEEPVVEEHATTRTTQEAELAPSIDTSVVNDEIEEVD